MKTRIDTSYMEAHARTRGFMLGRPVKPRPTPDGRAVLFLRARARAPQLALYEHDVASGRTRELATPAALLAGGAETVSAEEHARRERQRISVGGFTDLQLDPSGARVLLALSGRLWVLDRASGAARELPVPAGALDPRWSPDGRWIAYVRDWDLHALEVESGRERRITSGGSAALTHGLAEFVAQEEMGRMHGYWWSPDSRLLAFEEADLSGVETWWVADPARPGQAPLASRYPRPGAANAVARVGVVPVEGGEPAWVPWDALRYEYLTQVRWEAGGPLTLAVQTREQKEVALLAVDAGGATRTLLVERDRAWQPVKRDVPRWLGPDAFVWSREVSGQRRLEVRDAGGAIQRVLHRQRGGQLEVLDVDRAGGWLYFRASEDPRESHVCRVPLGGGRSERLTRESGVHTAVVAAGGGLLVIESALAGAMPRATVHASDGRQLAELPSVAEEPPFRPRAELTRIGERVRDAAGGWYASIVRPRNFRAGRKYPVLVDVYGGPGHNKVLASMGTRLVPQWLADQGFIVVSLDSRGTPGRGRAWERPLYTRIGAVPLADQVAGLAELGRRHPELDLTRAGIVGWSFGGYLSALAVLERPDVFRAAVAGAPVVDWQDYDTHYTERFMGLPAKNRTAYREASLLPLAGRGLQRPLLIVHGTADDNVYFVHALKLADALFRAGSSFELVPLAGLTHMVPEPVVAQRLWGRIAEHFIRHLGRSGK